MCDMCPSEAQPYGHHTCKMYSHHLTCCMLMWPLGGPWYAGCAALSFGVHCARLAGLDPGVLQRAKEVPWQAQDPGCQCADVCRQHTLVPVASMSCRAC